MNTRRVNPEKYLKTLAILAGFALAYPVQSTQAKAFSGAGIATLPLFNTGLAVTFESIGINSLMQLTSGEVKVVRDELNMTLFGDTPNTSATGGGTGTGTTGSTGYPPITDTVTIPAVYDSIVVVNDTTVIVYTPDGSTTTVTVDLGGDTSTLLVPADGNMDNAQIVYDGAAHPYTPGSGGQGGTTTQKKYSGFLARFYPNDGQIYGFDSMRFEQYTSYYQEMLVNGKLVKLPWKALEQGKTDRVNLSVKRSSSAYPLARICNPCE